MQKELIKNGVVIPYTVRSDRRTRRVFIRVREDGSVVVTKPRFLSFARIERFVMEKFEWIEKVRAELETRPKKILAHFSAKDFHDNKARALKVVLERIAHFNQFYNFEIKNISIRNQKTRWGSASGKKNLNFNYKIVFLPPELRDYIIVHEICHLGELNHSKNFWQLVGKQVPGHKALRKQIKLY